MDLTKNLPEDILTSWMGDEEKAMSFRGEALDIYRPRIIQSKTIIQFFKEPGFVEIKLTWHEKFQSAKTGLLKWLCNGLTMEDELYVSFINISFKLTNIFTQ